MVKSVTLTQDHTTKDGQELKKGQTIKVYKPLLDELTKAKVIKTTKQAKEEKK